MGNNFLYIPESDSWNPVEISESGLPLTPEIIKIVEQRDAPANIDQNLIEGIQRNCEELAKSIPLPVGSIMVTFDCDSGEWVANDRLSLVDYHSSDIQEWPSWTQKDNSRWYAPVDPEDSNFPQAWDEVEQSWYEMHPPKTFETIKSADIQLFPSWSLSEDGLWHAPVDPPSNDILYIWDESNSEWLTVSQARERYGDRG